MSSKKRLVGWILPVVILVAAFAAARLLHLRNRLPAISVQGAVIRKDADLKKEIPIADAEISVVTAFGSSACQSDASGFFWLELPAGVPPRQPLTLVLRHAGYERLQVNVVAGDKSYVARMVPIAHEANVAHHAEAVIANVDVRYSVKSTAVQNVGSVVRTFEAVNKGNVPCNGHNPCSPDGRWKAAVGTLSVDAGDGNEIRNARVSCIAGPCPFTRIDPNRYSRDGHTLIVSALDWSDTATFLLEAEVDRPMVTDTGRESYPVTFGDALNFTLPQGADGVFIEAELNGTPLVFPLGPSLLLSWADCNSRTNRDDTQAFRCTLKPGYRFQ